MRPATPGYPEYSTAALDAAMPTATSAIYNYLHAAAFELHWAASSQHYTGAYHPTNNPAITAMQAAGMNAANTPSWDSCTDLHAHERIHCKNFKRYAEMSWPAFQDIIDRIGVSMEANPSKADVLASQTLKDPMDTAERVLKTRLGQLLASADGFENLGQPDTFYQCFILSLQGFINNLNQRRTSNSCAIPARPPMSCPN